VLPKPYILVVEDDFDIRDILTEILRDEGYRVGAAANGQEALDCLNGGDLPSLILLDLMMPVMNGWQFRAAQLSDPRLAGIPVIVISADTSVQDKAAVLGAAHVLTKPIQLDRLLEIIRGRLPAVVRSR
jgi:CheY-like chemotaxis protein